MTAVPTYFATLVCTYWFSSGLTEKGCNTIQNSDIIDPMTCCKTSCLDIEMAWIFDIKQARSAVYMYNLLVTYTHNMHVTGYILWWWAASACARVVFSSALHCRTSRLTWGKVLWLLFDSSLIGGSQRTANSMMRKRCLIANLSSDAWVLASDGILLVSHWYSLAPI